MNEGKRVLQRTERAVERGYLDHTLAMQLGLEAQAAIAIELGRIANVLEREFRVVDVSWMHRNVPKVETPEWDGMFTGDWAVWQLVDGEVLSVDVATVGGSGLTPRFFKLNWTEATDGYLNEEFPADDECDCLRCTH